MLTSERVNTCRLRHVEGVQLVAFLDDAHATDNLRRLCRELQHLVVQDGAHPAESPLEVLCADGGAADLEFPTLVAHVAHVGAVAGETGGKSHRVVQEHVGGLLVVVFDAGVQSAVEEGSFKADVQVAVLLPRHFFVLQCRDESTRSVAIGIAQVVETLPCVVVGIAIGIQNVIVTLLTVADLKRQVIEPVNALHKLLFGDTPVSTYRPERTSVVVAIEA